jgi:predicted Zn-dependent peptidase
MPHVRSVSVGVWIAAGSRYESPKINGAAHFIEHMLFKGTETRSALELANVMDEIGGQVNAFTSREVTCFHGRVLDERFRQLIDVLSDMILHSRFDEKDVANERGVITEEIDMYEDTPDEMAAERLFGAVYKGSMLARPILGTRTSLARLNSASLLDFMRQHYVGGGVVVAVSGAYTADDLEYVAEKFIELESGKVDMPDSAEYHPTILVRHKMTEQNHICVGFPGCSLTDERRFIFQHINNILGGGVSSRLFQKIREELGLCYSLYSAMAAQSDSGLITIGFALSHENEREATMALNDELKRFVDNGVTEDELQRSFEQVKSNLLLGLESTATRMTRLGRGEMTWGSTHSVDETIAGYASTTTADILALSREIFIAEHASLSAVGRVPTRSVYAQMLLQDDGQS